MLARTWPFDLKALAEYAVQALQLFRALTRPDVEPIYVFESEGWMPWRFWPHRSSTDYSWVIEPIPNGCDVDFVSSDFQWGFYGAEGSWNVCLFGERIVDALAEARPKALSRTLVSLS